MSRKLIVTKETEADILNGYLSYEEKQESIGLRLLEELNRPSIEFYPIPFYHEVKTDIRRAVTHTFPYLVF